MGEGTGDGTDRSAGVTETIVTIAVAVGFFLALMACVALHEVGHMVPAKLFGVRVPKYFVGFGKTLWSTRRGETEYGLKIFPLGGFVQLLGMYPPRRPDARESRLQRLADEARAVEWEDISPGDRGRLFYEQSTPKKIVMMAGGITMNLLLSFLLFWGVTAIHGVYRLQPVVAGVVECMITVQREDMSTCQPSDPRTPAALAGLAKGDRVVAFNGVAISDQPQLQDLIRGNGDGEASIVVERGGERVQLPTVHTVVRPVQDKLDPSRTVPAGWLGFSSTSALEKGGPLVVLRDMRDLTAQSFVALAQLPIKTYNVVADMIGGKPRDVYSPISVVGASVVAGEVVSGEGTPGDKVATLAGLLASVNLFLALFNVVPLPPLDGGHIAGALYEGARRVVARLRGRPDPGPVDTAKMLPVAYFVGALLVLFGVILIVADIVSPIKIF